MMPIKCIHKYKVGKVIVRDYSNEKSTTFSVHHGVPVFAKCMKCKKCGNSIIKKEPIKALKV